MKEAGIYPKKPAPGVSRTFVYSPITVFPKRAGLVPALAEVMLPFLYGENSSDVVLFPIRIRNGFMYKILADIVT